MNHPISHILIPGRHHVLTQFQYDYLKEALEGRKKDLDGKAVPWAPEVSLIWAITSANHANTRRNPLPGGKRELAIEHFGLAESYAFAINDLGPTPRFADYVIKDIEVQSRGQFRLTPQNTVVAVSTPAVIELYEKLGFRILPLELAKRGDEKYGAPRAWDVVLAIAAAGDNWQHDPLYEKEAHPSSKYVLEKYRLGGLIQEVYNDPILGDEGDITETRDYAVYRQAFEDGAERKYSLVREHIKAGRIVDVGCATGAIIKLMSDDDDLSEADLYGVEVARPLYEICQQRRAAGEFGNENVFFYQRNIMTGKLFPDNTVMTTTTFALTHEIESYMGREALEHFIRQVYEQTALGGVFINADVVGPEHGDTTVALELSRTDGQVHQAITRRHATPEELAEQSTYGRFQQFAHDFRAEEDNRIDWRVVDEAAGRVELSLNDACEFLSKKDYLDSWYSEMHERFCYWSVTEWKAALRAAGFKVKRSSHSYRNDWIVEHRWEGKAKLLKKVGHAYEPMDWPVTNMVVVGEKY
ncbi:MAG TPA: class I SAM-dependent methyltransferase [Candidatus Saccharimonas sp.]|nr:class I SAM-dependent methyltransferase [Candidatus Saccharimonas sp.]